MRIAVVSDVHGNLPALEAVLADLSVVAPDQVVYGGDLALGGPHPREVVAMVRELGWPSVLGNTDVVLRGEAEIGAHHRGFVADAARRTIAMLDQEAIDWLTSRPLEWTGHGLAVMHAVPGDCWEIVPYDAPNHVLTETYGAVGAPTVAYGHIHHAHVRRLPGLTVVNSGSVSLALDGDVRAKYAVIDGDRVEHRLVAYDVERVAAEYALIDYPNASGYASWLRSGRYEG